MKKNTLLGFLALLVGVSASHAEIHLNELETSASISRNWNGDYSGYGVSLKASAPISENRHHFAELETNFVSLKNESSSSVPHASFPGGTVSGKSNSSIDEYFLFLN